MNKKRIFQSLQYTWWIYLLIIIIPFFLYKTIYTAILEPKDFEKVEIAIFSKNEFNASLFNSDFDNIVSSINDNILSNTIKRVRIDSIFSDSSTFGQLLLARKQVCDIIIVEENQILKSNEIKTKDKFINITSNFKRIDEVEFINTYSSKHNIDKISFYKIDDVPYGIILTSDNNNFSKYSNSSKTYVALFQNSSINNGTTKNNTHNNNTGVLDVIAYLLEDKDE